MKQILTMLCLLSLPAFAAEPTDKHKRSDPPKREERRHSAVHRTTIIYVRPRPVSVWGSIAGHVAGAVTAEIIESRRAARAERLYRQHEESQSYNDPNAYRSLEPLQSKIDRTPISSPVVASTRVAALAEARPVPVEAKPEVKTEAKPDPNAFKAKIYGLN